MVTSLGHFVSWVAEMVVFGGIEYVVTVTLHEDALGVAHWMFVQLVPSINYTVFPAVQGGWVARIKLIQVPKKFIHVRYQSEISYRPFCLQ